MRYRDILAEKVRVIEVKPMYRGARPVQVAFNPTRTEMIGLQRRFASDSAYMQLRGIVFKDCWAVWPANQAVHNDVEQALDKIGEYDDFDTPEEHKFFVEIGEKIIFIGNPEFCQPFIPRWTSVFDCIDLPSGEWTDYQDSEWGLPCRGTDRTMG